MSEQMNKMMAFQAQYQREYESSLQDKYELQTRLRKNHIVLVKEWNTIVKKEIPGDLELTVMTDGEFKKLADEIRLKFHKRMNICLNFVEQMKSIDKK